MTTIKFLDVPAVQLARVLKSSRYGWRSYLAYGKPLPSWVGRSQDQRLIAYKVACRVLMFGRPGPSERDVRGWIRDACGTEYAYRNVLTELNAAASDARSFIKKRRVELDLADARISSAVTRLLSAAESIAA